jgi:hypothetical protein
LPTQGRSGLDCSVWPEAEAAWLAHAGRSGPVAGQRPSRVARCGGTVQQHRLTGASSHGWVGVRNGSKGRGGLGEEREKGPGRGDSLDVGWRRVRQSGRAQQQHSNGEDNEKLSCWLGELHGVRLRLSNLEAETEVAQAVLLMMRWQPSLAVRRERLHGPSAEGANGSGGGMAA